MVSGRAGHTSGQCAVVGAGFLGGALKNDRALSPGESFPAR